MTIFDESRRTATIALNNQDCLRYSRQLLLQKIGLDGQQRLQKATVLLAGLGGLGSPAAARHSSAGVGTPAVACLRQ